MTEGVRIDLARAAIMHDFYCHVVSAGCSATFAWVVCSCGWHYTGTYLDSAMVQYQNHERMESGHAKGEDG